MPTFIFPLTFNVLLETSWDESRWVQRSAKLEAKESEEKQGSVLKPHRFLHASVGSFLFLTCFIKNKQASFCRKT